MSRVFISIFAALVLLAGCSDEEDILPTQKTKIVSYLTGTHSPKLVAYEELEEGSDEPYFTTSGNADLPLHRGDQQPRPRELDRGERAPRR